MPPAPIRRLVLYLVKPSKYDEDGYVIRYWRGVLPSNTLAVLAGLTDDVRARGVLGPLAWRVELIDEHVQAVPVRAIQRLACQRGTKVVVALVGVQSNQFARAADLALACRAAGLDVLLGGFHVSGSLALQPEMPPEIRRLLDAGVTVVAGEVEQGRWEGILRDALAGTLRPLYNFLAAPPALEAAPLPVLSRRHLRRFVSPNFGTLDCGRGCPFSCSFCTVINVQGRAMRFRDPARLLALIRDNYRRRRISYYFFTDDNFCRNRHWETILDGLIRLRAEEGIRLAFMMQVDTQSYKLPRFVEKAKAAGCSQVFIGLESLNAQNLAAAGKRQNRVEEFRALVSAYRAAGVMVHVAYIIGFPFDTLSSVRDDLARLRQEVEPEQASFFILTPLPGSRDHAALLEQGAALDPDLNQYDSFHVTTAHPRMTAEAWRQAYEEAWTAFYSLENMQAILRRVPRHRYWGVFSNFIWYKNAIAVEGGHPMIHGFVRLKGRLARRSGWPIESPRRYAARRVADAVRTLRRWTALALEMEEVWLRTRPRGAWEVVLARSVTTSRASCRRVWRELRRCLVRGPWHQVNVGGVVCAAIQDSALFLWFASTFLRQFAGWRRATASVRTA